MFVLYNCVMLPQPLGLSDLKVMSKYVAEYTKTELNIKWKKSKKKEKGCGQSISEYIETKLNLW